MWGFLCVYDIYIEKVIMKKYIFTEEQIKKVIDGMINEQSVSNKFNVPAKTTAVALPTMKIDSWKGFANYMKLTYDYVVESENKLTYTLENKLTLTLTFTQSDVNPDVGAMAMTITFIDPNIVKTNGPIISKIQTMLGARLTNNAIVGNKPQGYLTQNINNVAKMLYFNVKVDGNVIADIEGQKIKGDVMGGER
jgi:hypothetical protein